MEGCRKRAHRVSRGRRSLGVASDGPGAETGSILRRVAAAPLPVRRAPPPTEAPEEGWPEAEGSSGELAWECAENPACRDSSLRWAVSETADTHVRRRGVVSGSGARTRHLADGLDLVATNCPIMGAAKSLSSRHKSAQKLTRGIAKSYRGVATNTVYSEELPL